MDNVVQFPQVAGQRQQEDDFDRAMRATERRLGVSFWDYIGENGKRSKIVQDNIDKSLRKETFQIPSAPLE